MSTGEVGQRTPMKGLTTGRMVHYVLDRGPNKGEHRAAVVTSVADPVDGGVTLEVMTTTLDLISPNELKSGVYYYDDSAPEGYPQTARQGTWHWIEPA